VQPTASTDASSEYAQSQAPGDYVEFLLPGLVLPLPDEAAALAAWERLSAIDIGVNAPTIAGLGMLAEAVAFIAGVQATAFPRPVLSTRVVLVTGAHAGGVVAGPAPDPRTAVPLQQLANQTGAGSVTLEWQPASAAIELEDAITPEQMDMALRAGWAEAERAADEGIEMLVLAAGGAGASAAAVAVISAITGYEATALLGRVVTPAGLYDDNAWMTRCLALRDALHRVRHRNGDPRTVLSALGGADIAAATGLILGAASRRMPVMIDGPVGAAAALLANEFAPHARKWLLMPDTGRNVAVTVSAEALELRPWLDLCLDLGEGVTSLVALSMLQTALTLAGAGEPVEAGPLTRFDSSTGSQIFVGVARPVEPAEAEVEEEPAPKPAPAKSIGAKAKIAAKPTPPKTGPSKAPPAKAAAARAAAAKNPKRTPAARTNSGPAKAGPAKSAPPAKPDDAKPDDAKPDDAKSGEPGSDGGSAVGPTATVPSQADQPARQQEARREEAGTDEAGNDNARNGGAGPGDARKDAADKDAADKDAARNVDAPNDDARKDGADASLASATAQGSAPTNNDPGGTPRPRRR
jgi:nicotinate-nucleotide--dimethylbenzimidazole phosphoribosyltransferase